MLITNKLKHNFHVKNKNRGKMRNILDFVSTKMQEQGQGCFIAGLGVAYYNPKERTRDPIGHLLGLTKTTYHFGPISDEAQKPMVKLLIARSGIDVSRDCERDNFINFLQALQDAHDVVFDRFANKDEPEQNLMPMFRGNCNQIAYDFNLL